MILEGNARGNGGELARHLMNARDNEHVTIHAIQGFVADDLAGAFAEAEALANATQCQKYLFSLSLNPPPHESVPVEVFEAAIERIAQQLGLAGQPCAVIFHEKDCRRHAHCVWSRIDPNKMKAINLPHFKRKLMATSRELYMENGWDMLAGFEDFRKRDPLNYSREEAQQAKRLDRNPKALKALFHECWERSDTRSSFAAALWEHGFALARGEQRGFVAVDRDCKIWSLSRWCGVTTKLLKQRLGDPSELPSIDEAKALLAQSQAPEMPQRVKDSALYQEGLTELVSQQRRERAALAMAHQDRQAEEVLARNARVPRGMALIWSRLSGAHGRLVDEFAQEKVACDRRDRTERQELIDNHLSDRRAFTQDMQRLHLGAERAKSYDPEKTDNAISVDPRQALRLPKEKSPFSTAQIQCNPRLILNVIAEKEATFGSADIKRGLAKHIDDPNDLRLAIDAVLASPELVCVDQNDCDIFTTQNYCDQSAKLDQVAHQMAMRTGYRVGNDAAQTAIEHQNAKMKRRFGGELSAEQVGAIHHVLNDQQLAQVVGLAGAGKSTMLATAYEAWSRQNVKVHGAALSGKAAEGLQTSSGIGSRTLASLELSWANGNQPIKAGEVLVIDEAGMIGTRQMQRIMTQMHAIGAKLVLVGDPDQLQPIEAGTPFRKLVDGHGAARLTEIHRQKEHWQKQASRDLAEGRIAEAIQAYDAYGTVRKSTHLDDALAALVEDYMVDVSKNGGEPSRLAFAHRRKDVHALNQAIRTVLRRGRDQAAPSAQETMYLTDMGYRAFAKGERIVFTQNNREMGVKNGMLGTVTHADEHGMTVRLDSEDGQRSEITINPHQYRSFDHGYAVTVHKSQGATVDRSYVLASKSMDHSLAYVAMTRHREEMKLFLNTKDMPLWMDEEQLTFEQTKEELSQTQTIAQQPKPTRPKQMHHPKRNGPSR
ncbi:AAA family ATPase [Tateyamaria sp.]|uniref:AAA family ATPase n=1 Tax=Tateyamaria sp. TaxID=1929288 RepID=UPI00329E4434